MATGAERISNQTPGLTTVGSLNSEPKPPGNRTTSRRTALKALAALGVAGASLALTQPGRASAQESVPGSDDEVTGAEKTGEPNQSPAQILSLEASAEPEKAPSISHLKIFRMDENPNLPPYTPEELMLPRTYLQGVLNAMYKTNPELRGYADLFVKRSETQLYGDVGVGGRVRHALAYNPPDVPRNVPFTAFGGKAPNPDVLIQGTLLNGAPMSDGDPAESVFAVFSLLYIMANNEHKAQKAKRLLNAPDPNERLTRDHLYELFLHDVSFNTDTHQYAQNKIVQVYASSKDDMARVGIRPSDFVDKIRSK